MSILLAKFIAVYYLAAGIGMLLQPKAFKKLIEDYTKSVGLVFVSGIVGLTIGLLMVTYHNIWVKDWTVLVTIIGWIAVAKGLLFTAFPGSFGFFKSWVKNPQPWAIFVIALGAIFAYFSLTA